MAKKNGFAEKPNDGNSHEWYTPPEIFTALDLKFDLDPCSPGAGKSYVPAEKHYTKEDDGLIKDWEGTVWVNPPYGPNTALWLKKLTKHGDGIALVFARTDTKWFQEAAKYSDIVCFISSRVKFYQGSIDKQGGTPAAGSMLIAYGEKCKQAILNSQLGLCFECIKKSEIPVTPVNLFTEVLGKNGE